MEVTPSSPVKQQQGEPVNSIEKIQQSIGLPSWWRWAFYFLGIMLIGGITVIIWDWNVEKTESKRLERFYQIETETLPILKKLDAGENPSDLPTIFGRSIDKLKEIIKEKNKGPVANLCGLLLSELYLRLGNLTQAVEALQLVDADVSTPMGIFLKNRELQFLLDLKKWDEVLSKSEFLLKQDSMKLVTPEVYVSRALALHQKGMTEAATIELKRIKDLKLPENSMVLRRAQKLLRLWDNANLKRVTQ
ncbi:MAG: hypothetical protein RMK80_09200 [Pseudobdellovibrionaceae bacterium]|nr:hypothetical protein [Pseudobdellovibrionaceae bacterium]